MELIISRLNNHHQGLNIAFKEFEELRTIATINGNTSEFTGPIILLSLDQHIIYGMSHPEVVSRILEKGPQNLITTKELAHNLYEHGMKAALGKVKINMNNFNTTIDTFYTLIKNTTNITLLTGTDNQLACLIQPRKDIEPILISNSVFNIKENEGELRCLNKVELDHIRTYVTVKCKHI